MSIATSRLPAPSGPGADDGGETSPRMVALYWVLRVGVAMEFVGHGLAGLAHSKAWFAYYDLFGISKEAATGHWFNITGTVDIAIGLLVLCFPVRAVLVHMTFWGLMTAVLRPLAGESFFELVERGGNYALPLAFLVVVGLPRPTLRSWFVPVQGVRRLSEWDREVLAWTARIGIALLLVGHGGLGVWADKPEWNDFFGFFGIGTDAVASAHLSQVVGLAEIALGLAVLVRPFRELLWLALVWKVGTELLRPLVGQPMFQFVERSGDYALPAALLLLGSLVRTERLQAPDVVVGRDAVTGRPAGPRPFPQQWHNGDGTVRSPLGTGG